MFVIFCVSSQNIRGRSDPSSFVSLYLNIQGIQLKKSGLSLVL